MKTLYLECGMGAAGDMLTAALLELTDDRQGFVDRMNSIGLPGVKITAEPSVKCGVKGFCFGRNLFQSEEAAERIEKLYAILHQ